MAFLRPQLPPYAGPLAIVWHYAFRVLCFAIFVFLLAPLLVIVPLSFNAESFFSFTDGMLALKASAFSLKWYRDIFTNGMLAPDAPPFHVALVRWVAVAGGVRAVAAFVDRAAHAFF